MAIASEEFIGKRISKQLSDSIYPKLSIEDIKLISIQTELHPNTIMNLLKGYSNLTNYNSPALTNGARIAFGNNEADIVREESIKTTLTKFIEAWKL